MQVAAYCNGRDFVSEYDCLLLQHVLWQRPAEADRIYDWLLSQLAVDDGIKQVGGQGRQLVQHVACCCMHVLLLHACRLLPHACPVVQRRQASVAALAKPACGWCWCDAAPPEGQPGGTS